MLITTPSRIAIYARYSSNLQNPSSVEDQISHCRLQIERQFASSGQESVLVFSDAAISGSTMERNGLSSLMKAAAHGAFDLLIAEGLDRLSRSLKDIAGIYEQLVYYGVKIWTSHEGNIGPLHIGMKGTMNAIYLQDMKEKVRRGQRARIEAGFASSSPPYGYNVVRGVIDENRRNVNGVREINEEHSAVVRRVYQEFADGHGTKEIVRRLNQDGFLSPQGKLWRPNRLLGSRAKGEGMLRNEHYRGFLVYNKTRLMTDPVTNRKKYTPNPESMWTRSEVPELRIIDEKLWKQVRELDAKRVGQFAKAIKKAKQSLYQYNQRPLTGFVKCGVCGGLKSIANDSRYLCSTNRYARKCQNARGTREDVIKRRVFIALINHIERDKNLYRNISKTYERECIERSKNITKVIEIEKRIERLLDAIERGVEVETVSQKICTLQDNLSELKKKNEALLEKVPENSEIQEKLINAINHFETCFSESEMIKPIRTMFQMLVQEIILNPIKSSHQGETIDINLRNEGWPEFWNFIHN